MLTVTDRAAQCLLLTTHVGDALSNANLDVQEFPEGTRITLSEAGTS